MAVIGSKALAIALVAVAAICSLAGVVTAAEGPAPSPTSAGPAVYAPIATAFLFSAAAFFVGALRH